MSHVVRKPVYAICEQQRRRSAWSETPKTGFLVTWLKPEMEATAVILNIRTDSVDLISLFLKDYRKTPTYSDTRKNAAISLKLNNVYLP